MTSVEASDTRRTFCARLKIERERRGRSLVEIAGSTKIKASLLDALERGDLSRWPKGIYRRSFFRDYVSAIGLNPDPFVSEFLDVFAEATPPAPATVPSDPISFRMTFAENVRPASAAGKSHELTREARLLAAGIDVVAVSAVAALAAATLAATTTPVPFATLALGLGIVGYVVSVWLGSSLGTWLLLHHRAQKAPTAPAVPIQTFSASSLPYNAYAPMSGGSAVKTRLGLAVRMRTLFTESLERIMELPIAANGHRRRDVASVRRRRVESANSTGADEFSIT